MLPTPINWKGNLMVFGDFKITALLNQKGAKYNFMHPIGVKIENLFSLKKNYFFLPNRKKYS